MKEVMVTHLQPLSQLLEVKSTAGSKQAAWFPPINQLRSTVTLIHLWVNQGVTGAESLSLQTRDISICRRLKVEDTRPQPL